MAIGGAGADGGPQYLSGICLEASALEGFHFNSMACKKDIRSYVFKAYSIHLQNYSLDTHSYSYGKAKVFRYR